MAEARYQAFRRLIEGFEKVLDNGNKIVNGKIGNYNAQLELRNLFPSGQQIFLNLEGSNKYGTRVIRHYELYENGLAPTKTSTDCIENKDPEFLGKLKFRFYYTPKKIFRNLITAPSIGVVIGYLFANKILGMDPSTSILSSILGTIIYTVSNIPEIIIERKKAISRIKVYDELKKLIS